MNEGQSGHANSVEADIGYPSELVSFANVRDRPSVFLFLAEALELQHLLQLRQALGKCYFDEIDLVIHSAGGNIHVAYQVIELLRCHTKKINACVPLYAKSAATLLCLGSDEIVVDILAQLGPLDPQIYEERRGGKTELTSALNPFKTLEQLQRFSLETLDIAAKMIVLRSGMDLDECLKHAIEFVRGTTDPLFAKLNPEKLGEYSRALAVGSEYGDRLLRRFTAWDENRRKKVLEQFVHGYPSHDYIIDFHELDELGFNVSLFSEEESIFVEHFIEIIVTGETIVALIIPTNLQDQETDSLEANHDE